MATKNVPTKVKTTSIVSWEDKLARYAADATAQEESVSTGSFISFKAGIISYQGNPAAGNKLQAVIVDSILENCYYDSDYDEDNLQPPVCYALGRDDKDMKPHEKSPKPQAASCSECEWNKYGTANNGKGKACANRRRLAMLPADPLSPEGLEKSSFATAKLPVMSVANWAAYVRTLKGLQKRPPMGVVTEVGCVPDTKSQFKVTFNHKLNLTNALLPIVDARMEEANDVLFTPYPEPSEDTPAPKKGAAKKGPAKTRKY